MKNIRIKNRGHNYYVVIADSERFGNNAIMAELSSKEKAKLWIRKNEYNNETSFNKKESLAVNELIDILRINDKEREQFNKFMDRCYILTSDFGYTMDRQIWKSRDHEYIIYELSGTRAALRIVVDECGNVIRKPRYIVMIENDVFSNLDGYDVIKAIG